MSGKCAGGYPLLASDDVCPRCGATADERCKLATDADYLETYEPDPIDESARQAIEQSESNDG